MPRRPNPKSPPQGGRPAERTETTTAFRGWLESHAKKSQQSYAQLVTVVASQLGRTRTHVYALANGTSKPSRKLAAAIETLSKGKVDAVRSW